MSFFRRFLRDCAPLVVPLMVVFLAGTVLYWAGFPTAAELVSWIGSVVVALGVLGYVAVRDPLGKWSRVPVPVRIVRLVTFRR